jgi:hypothetical protein
MTHGQFSGDPQAEWLTTADTPDRQMQMLADFRFLDPEGKEWITPAKYVVDGASIPRALWTLVGSPYTGDYRRASVVHDKACDDTQGDAAARRAADRMFYHACRAGGCSTRDAILLYMGVRIGALTPLVAAWSESSADNFDGPRLSRSAGEERLEADFRLAGQHVLAQGEVDDPFEIERRTDIALSTFTGLDLRGI